MEYSKMSCNNLEYSKISYNHWKRSKMSYNNLEYSKMFTGITTWNIPRCHTPTWTIPRCGELGYYLLFIWLYPLVWYDKNREKDSRVTAGHVSREVFQHWWEHSNRRNQSRCRLFHAPTRTTSSGCCMLHRTVHALWNLFGNPYRNRAEKEEETVTWRGNS